MPADTPAALVALVEHEDVAPDDVAAALVRLLRIAPRLGAQTALGVLSREPRIKPSTGLLVDPGDTVMRRWRRRVAAGQVLLASPVLPDVFDELYDELSDCPDLARDVIPGIVIDPAVADTHQAALADLVAECRNPTTP